MSGPLAGIRVLELGTLIAAPFASRIFAEFGAQVVKVEPPGGDPLRKWRKLYKGTSLWWYLQSRNKQSIALDLKTPEGIEIVRKLAAECDVLIENYKVGDLKRFGLDYERLREINPRLIYCSVTGYGQDGPMAARPGYDGLFQATGGIMAVTGIPEGQPGGGPLKCGPSLVDFVTGHNTAIAILAALMHRERTGEGQFIDIALLDTSVAMVSHIMQDYLLSGEAPPRLGNGGNGGGPADLMYCSDGIVYLTAGTDEHYRRLTVLMERPELFTDERFDSNFKRGKTNRAELMAIINAWSRGYTVAGMLAALDEVGIPAAKYNELPEVWEEPQVKHRGLRATTPHPHSKTGTVDLIRSPLAQMSATPATIRRPPPLIGEHTAEVLRELGYNDERIAEFGELKVV
jgi:crotonobetainyl-CoA:carnitine CoA-transferase CaiB-like acyl-CoA transferase